MTEAFKFPNELALWENPAVVSLEAEWYSVSSGHTLYGWRRMEGFLCFNPSINCNPGGLTRPAIDYGRDGGACSVIGGYVYRGAAMPSLRGAYLYADFCAGFVRSFRSVAGSATEAAQWPALSPPGGLVTSVGEDGAGELYLMSRNGGLWRIVPE